jgi:uncharacterized integral membrane protein (TIGR00698 family)
MTTFFRKYKDTLLGIGLVLLFSLVSVRIAGIKFLADRAISPLIVGILLGMLFGNTLRAFMPKGWSAGIVFCAKVVLRLAIIFYGFRITFQQIAGVGMQGLFADLFMLTTTFLIGAFFGKKVLRMDEETAFMAASGASVCGAAAVLATEPVVKADTSKTAVAVATVVVFGTISMFLYPVIYRAGMVHLSANSMGVYIGSTVHEVAQVVGSGTAISQETADTGVIVKMTRVMMLVPLLLVLSYYISSKSKKRTGVSSGGRITIPWFALGFIGMAVVNSFHIFSRPVTDDLVIIDTFLLTMAMTALGMETNLEKVRKAGGKAFVLAFVMFVWLVLGGYAFSKLIC